MAVPSPWTDADVGSPSLAGSADYSSGTFTVHGAGSDMWDSVDQFHFVYQPRADDGAISARVVSQTNTDGWAKAGVIMRADATDAGAVYFGAFITPGNGADAQWRTTEGGSTTNATTSRGTPVFLQVDWEGDNYTASWSTDGSSWTELSTQSIPALTGTLQVGLVVCSHNAGSLGTAVFDSLVGFTGARPPSDGISVTLADSLMALALNGTSYAGNTHVWCQLHVGPPGPGGTANVAGNNVRATCGTTGGFTAPSGGTTANAHDITWTDVSTTETYTHCSIWSASSSGTFLCSGSITGASVTSGDTFVLPAGQLTLAQAVAA